jgi:hypothetical protein
LTNYKDYKENNNSRRTSSLNHLVLLLFTVNATTKVTINKDKKMALATLRVSSNIDFNCRSGPIRNDVLTREVTFPNVYNSANVVMLAVVKKSVPCVNPFDLSYEKT